MYAQTGAQGDALAERIRSMTKEVEVGDEFPGAKVVKTTTFGAFVELAKGTDGLLHISNVSPGQRVGTVEEVLNKGDEISVRVVEVDRERGRIGLRLAEDPEIAGKTKEELATVGSGGGGGGGDRGGDRGGRGGRGGDGRRNGGGGGGRGRDRDRGERAPARRSRPRPGLTRCRPTGSRSCPQGCGSRRRSCPPSGPRPWASSWAPARAARRWRRRGSRTSSSTCCSAAPTATRRRRSTSSSTRWAPS